MDKRLSLVSLLVFIARVTAEKDSTQRYCRPLIVENSRYEPKTPRDLIPVGDVVTYTCFPSYELNGEATLTCTDDGWDALPPTCVLIASITCPRQPLDDSTFANGFVEPPDTEVFTPGQKIWYRCLAGYAIQRGDDQDITCLTTGEWSGSLPTCVVGRPSCTPLPVPANGRYTPVNEIYYIGDEVEYECQEPYIRRGPLKRICLIGVWSHSDTTCEAPQCRKPRTPSQGSIAPDKDFYEVGETIQFECQTNYRLSTDVTSIRCLDNGRWSEREPDCVEITCGPLIAPDSGSLDPIQDQYSVGARIRFSCIRFYRLIGATNVICQESGTWSADVPTCRAPQCGKPVINKGSFEEEKDRYDVGDTVTFECEETYQLTGEETLTCQRNGRWSGDFPRCEEVRCARPEISNGGFRDDRVTYRSGAEVVFFCDTGFVLQGERTLRCNGNEGWSDEFPVCILRQCDRPTFLKGTISPDAEQYNFRTVISFECDDGYTLTGSLNAECKEDGSWSNEIPTCDAIQCSKPEFPNGRLIEDQDSYAVGQVLRFQCGNRYRLVGAARLTCQIDGEWSDDIPTCRLLSCDRPTIVKGSFAPNQRRYFPGNSVTFSCTSGYELVGAEVVNCLNTQEWDAAFPVCSEIKCQRPTVANGIPRPNFEEYSVGQEVRYVCSTGYRLVGAPRLTCQNDKTWSEDFPTCRRVQCRRPVFPDGELIVSQDFYEVNDVVVFRCNEGFTLRGESSSTCQENGRFSPSVPTCLRNRCSRPTPFDNGSLMPSQRSYDIGVTVTFECNDNFFLLGVESITCQNDGTWTSEEFPFCVVFTCSRPSIDNGSFREDKETYDIGDVVAFTCDVGFSLEGASSSVACGNEGEWSDAFPTCRENMCRREDVSNGVPSDDKRLFSATELLTITCGTGYRLDGVETLICQDSGFWSDDFPTCTAVQCARPDFDNGRLDPSRNNYDVETYISFICSSGYRLIGEDRAKCQPDGTWSEDIPTCRAVTCSRPRIADGTFLEVQRTYSVGDRVRFFCDDGFGLMGRNVLRCRNDGTWSSSFPTCELLRCARPTFLQGTLDEDQETYAVGETVRFICERNYELVGAESLECRRNQMWSGDFPTCRPLQCSGPEIDNGNFVPDQRRYVVGNTVTFSCINDYTLVGRRVLRCLNTRRWSAAFPTCTPITCSTPEIDNGSFEDDDLESYTVGVTVSFECDEGYVRNGNEVLTCQNVRGNGRWSEDFPTCEALACSRPRFDPRRGSFTPNQRVYPFDSTVSFECNNAHELVGASEIRCLITGRWSEDFPTCRIKTCRRPFIRDGTFEEDKESYNPDDSVRFSCNEGFRINTRNPVVTCRRGGSWSNEFPTCSQITCENPTINPQTGSFTPVAQTYVVGLEVTFECNNGFTLRGRATVQCRNNGRWSDSFPTCIQNRCRRPRGSTGLSFTPARRSYLVGAVVSFSCANGYVVRGVTSYTCQPNGQWDSREPTCAKVVRCPHPDPEPENSVTQSFQQFYDVGETITYSCQRGFVVRGNPTVTCQNSGSFTDARLTCALIRNACPRPYTPRYQEVTPHKEVYRLGEQITFSCTNNLVIQGATRARCTSSRTFSELTPSCVEGDSCRNKCDEDYIPNRKCYCQFYCNLLEQGCCRDKERFCPSRG